MKIYMTGDGGEYMMARVKVNNTHITSHCSASGHRNALDPILASIAYNIGANLGMTRRNSMDFTSQIEIGTQGFMALVQRHKNKYLLNGIAASKQIILYTLARVIYLSCSNDEGKVLFDKLYQCLNVPENIAYALENRAPYHWYENYSKIKVSLNIQQISDKKCAIEISDGIWGTITIKDLNTFLNYYRLDLKRGSWKMLSPASLWGRLMGQPPTESQLSLMIAFLKQNRTQDIVEERAEELIIDLVERFSDKLVLVDKKDEQRRMYVRGQLADWCLMEGGQKEGYQLVSTYIYTNENKGVLFQEGTLHGPICIDNLTKRVSVGDQFAARAIALMNDSIMVTRVSTIKRYLNQGHTKGQIDQRIDFNGL